MNILILQLVVGLQKGVSWLNMNALPYQPYNKMYKKLTNYLRNDYKKFI